MTTTSARVPASRAGTGEWWWFGELATHRLTALDTDRAMSIFEIVAPPSLEVPMHVHVREDETFVILDGSATFVVGGRTIEATAGDVLFGPRGVPHAYRTGPDGCRMLFVFTPGANMESFVAASAVPARASTVPPVEVVPPAPEVLEPLLEAHGLAFV